MSDGAVATGGPPPPAPSSASPDSLPAMNAAAASNGSEPSCKRKSWFHVSIYKVDDQNQEIYAEDVTIDLTITDLGQVQRVTSADAKPVKIPLLEPGGKGDVLQMTHDTDVYEAIGDFE